MLRTLLRFRSLITGVGLLILISEVSPLSGIDIYPVAEKENGKVKLKVAGITMGDSMEAIRATFSHSGMKTLRDTGTMLEYEGTSVNTKDIERIHLHFCEGRLYELTLVFVADSAASWDIYIKLQGLLKERYGPTTDDSKDGEGTYASVEWKDLYNEELNIKLIWEEDPGSTYIYYQYNPLYLEFLKTLSGDRDVKNH